MGSKKLKKKKLKCKKIEKVHKLKALKQKKTIFKIGNDKDCDKTSHSKIFTYNRSSKKNCSLSSDESENASAVNAFSKTREDYFIYLQRVISDNCAFYDSVVTEETLQNLALELEQNALLACLQVDIYKKSMCRIIREIKKSTEEKQVHEDVRKLLPESLQERNEKVKAEKPISNSTESASYSVIPTIASNRTDENSMSNTNFWTDQSAYDSNAYFVESGSEIYSENLNVNSSAQVWVENETFSPAFDSTSFWSSEVIQTNQSSPNELSCTEILNDQSSVSQNDISDINRTNNISPENIDKNEINNEKVDPLLVSRTHLQKLVEQTLIETEKIQKQKKDEQERAYIAQILEGDDSLEDRLNDSLSDNENESKENVDESNLMDRLDKMRELFGVEEEKNPTSKALDKPKPNNKVNNNVSSHTHRCNSWRYEKFIQLHKYSLIAGEMSYERRNINRKLFLELFGDDSDEEHEMEYSSNEKYRSSCSERISSWVVKYLMPFYHDKRILGRSVFKTLGHHISDTIVDAIHYPDEWTVKYFVSKFFPPKKKYICDADVLNFQLD